MVSKLSLLAGIALATTVASAPASAQYNTPAPAPQATTPPPSNETAPTGKRTLNVSKGAQNAVTALQAAVTANDAAAFAPALSAAQAAATTPDDRLAVAQLQLKYANARKDNAASAAAVEAMIAAGAASGDELARMNMALGQLRYDAKQYDAASAALEKVLAAQPAHEHALLLLTETRDAQGRPAEGLALLRKAIDAHTAAGGKAQESWYRRAVALAYKSNTSGTLDIARQWIAAYPSPASWRDGLNLLRNQSKGDEQLIFDILRLGRVTGAANPAQDAYLHAAIAIENGAGAEAQAVVDDAIAKGQFDRAKSDNKELLAALPTAAGRDAAGLAASAKNVTAAPTGRPALKIADAYYGVGDYAKAAELYRVALSKGSVDANLVNLRIGAALARAGDKAGATAALNAVTGPRAELAKFWLLYLSSRA